MKTKPQKLKGFLHLILQDSKAKRIKHIILTSNNKMPKLNICIIQNLSLFH